MQLLPEIADLEAYRAVYRDASVWLPAIREICRREGLDADALEQAPPGSHVVFRAGPRLLIKLFSRLWLSDAVSERLALGRLASHPEVNVPRLLAEGSLEGWPYMVLDPLPGIPLNQVWDQVELRDRLAVCETLGKTMSALHAVPTAGLDELTVDWPAWLAERREGFSGAQTERGASPEWIESALAFLEEMWPEVTQGLPVLLNADITDEHVLLAKDGGRWRMTGLIDFGDAMLGDALYDFTAPLVSIIGRDSGLRRALMHGYGYPDTALDASLSRRMAAMGLLHQFADLKYYLGVAGEPAPSCLANLLVALWSFPG